MAMLLLLRKPTPLICHFWTIPQNNQGPWFESMCAAGDTRRRCGFSSKKVVLHFDIWQPISFRCLYVGLQICDVHYGQQQGSEWNVQHPRPVVHVEPHGASTRKFFRRQPFWSATSSLWQGTMRDHRWRLAWNCCLSQRGREVHSTGIQGESFSRFKERMPSMFGNVVGWGFGLHSSWVERGAQSHENVNGSFHRKSGRGQDVGCPPRMGHLHAGTWLATRGRFVIGTWSCSIGVGRTRWYCVFRCCWHIRWTIKTGIYAVHQSVQTSGCAQQGQNVFNDSWIYFFVCMLFSFKMFCVVGWLVWVQFGLGCVVLCFLWRCTYLWWFLESKETSISGWSKVIPYFGSEAFQRSSISMWNLDNCCVCWSVIPHKCCDIFSMFKHNAQNERKQWYLRSGLKASQWRLQGKIHRMNMPSCLVFCSNQKQTPLICDILHECVGFLFLINPSKNTLLRLRAAVFVNLVGMRRAMSSSKGNGLVSLSPHNLTCLQRANYLFHSAHNWCLEVKFDFCNGVCVICVWYQW